MKKILCVMAFILSATVLFAQVNLTDTARKETDTMRTANSGFAEEEFRRGVQSYYKGAFNQSILQFEKALSYLPGENLILDWLGKAYYRSGIEGAALQQWQAAYDAGYGGILLQNRIEIVRERRITGAEYDSSQRYTESGSIPNKNGKKLIYSQPISVLPNDDGSIWIVAYGTNELVRFDVNGLVVDRVRGPLNGFDRPMDVIRLQNGNLLVSESAGDRLALLDKNGHFIKNIGEKGRGEGQLVGPQYLAEDSFGNIYVTDFGNDRVVVFDGDGNGLLHFGGKTDDFGGLVSPTGIAIVDDRVFVADSVKGAVYEFDRSGNYIGLLANEKSFARPESLKNWGPYLIVTDVNRVITIDTSTGALYENARIGNAPAALTSAVPDKNGNIIVTDFKSNEVYVMAKLTELVGGLFVQIERVISDNFPNVVVEVRVENRRRQAVVGLNESNFFITENKRPVTDPKLLGEANNNDLEDITLLVDRSTDMMNYTEQLQTAVREICASMNGKGTVRVVSAGSIPVIEFTGNPNKLTDFSPRALKSPYTDDGALDLAIRLCANDLINAEKKRAVIFLTTGTVGQRAFTKYGLADLTTYLNNNSIAFSTILLKEGTPSEETTYIDTNTNGITYYVYRPQGLSSVIKDLIALPSGLYQLSYTSALKTEYGRKYLPVEIETYLLNRSGRDESGYFAPLE
jgi:DNA-binding beta-propeller fold protein YncE